MSLTVKVTPDGLFAKLVQKALSDICGCQSVAVDALTGQVSIGPMDCACYCDHRAGCNLLTDIVRDPRSITILPSLGDSSGYDAGEVYWYWMDVDLFDQDTCGGTKGPASIMLGHELVHALHNSYDEDEAVRGENQIRKERCLPMRTEYSLEAVPDFRVGVLDASNRTEYGCNCSILRGGLCASVKRWLCILHSMYCVPRTVSAWWESHLTKMRRD